MIATPRPPCFSFWSLSPMSMPWLNPVSGCFDERDTRVFKAVGCTQDKQPAEALYYIVASRSDLSAGVPSPSSQFMKTKLNRIGNGSPHS